MYLRSARPYDYIILYSFQKVKPFFKNILENFEKFLIIFEKVLLLWFLQDFLDQQILS